MQCATKLLQSSQKERKKRSRTFFSTKTPYGEEGGVGVGIFSGFSIHTVE
jgi:hypothetical protein